MKIGLDDVLGDGMCVLGSPPSWVPVIEKPGNNHEYDDCWRHIWNTQKVVVQDNLLCDEFVYDISDMVGIVAEVMVAVGDTSDKKPVRTDYAVTVPECKNVVT